MGRQSLYRRLERIESLLGLEIGDPHLLGELPAAARIPFPGGTPAFRVPPRGGRGGHDCRRRELSGELCEQSVCKEGQHVIELACHGGTPPDRGIAVV
ncbi:hypothetical protein [Streptomyces sp. T12]|uniref:hypothetical protein n=1 Tax=Streptomyces sp. T12 TaxID=477697 RepID=UPI0035A3CF1A